MGTSEVSQSETEEETPPGLDYFDKLTWEKKQAKEEQSAILAGVLELLKKLEAENAEIKEELKATKNKLPSIQPMERPFKQTRPLTAQEVWAGLNQGQEAQGLVKQIPLQTNGLPLTEYAKAVLKEKFRPGMRVRINRDVTHGTGRAFVVTKTTNAEGELIHTERHPAPKGWVKPAGHLGPKDTWVTEEIEIEMLSWGQVLDTLRPMTCPTDTCGEIVRVGDVCANCGWGPEIQKRLGLHKNEQWRYMVRVPGLTSEIPTPLFQYELEMA